MLMGKKESIFLILFISIVVNIGLIKAPFLYDDRDIILENRELHKISNIKNIFSKDYYNITKEVSFRPVVSVFHFVNYFIWGNRAYGFRILELLIYSLICVCMYILCLKLFQNQTIAFISAVVFSLHPVHCEALGCISLGYGELLFSLFFLLAFIFYLNALEEFNVDNIVFSYLFWIFALLSKETAVILPVIILAHLVIYKYLNSRADSGIVQLRDSVGKKLLCFLSGYVLIAIFYLIIRFSVFNVSETKYLSYIGGSFYINMLSMLNVFGQYILLLFFPIKLAIEYPPIIITSVLNRLVILNLTLVILIVIALSYLIKNKKWNYLFASVWIIVPLLPTMNLIPFLKASLLNVRYLFIPSIGFSWLVGFCIFKINKNRYLGNSLLVILLCFFAFKTVTRNYAWMDEIRLWSKNVEMYPDFPRPRLSLAGAYYYKGMVKESIDEYEKVILLDTNDPEAYYNLGAIKARYGDIEGALKEYKKVLEIIKYYPQDAPLIIPVVQNTYGALARIYENQNNEKYAIFYYRKIDKENYYLAKKYFKLAKKYTKEKKYNEAKDNLNKVLQYYPLYFEAYNELSHIYNIELLYNEAIQSANEAIRINTGYSNAYFNIGWAYNNLKEIKKAIKYYEKGLKFNSNEISALYELGKLYDKQRKYKKSKDYYLKIINLKPDYLNIYTHLAVCYLNLKDYKSAEEIIKKGLEIFPNDKTLNNNYNKIRKAMEKEGKNEIQG